MMDHVDAQCRCMCCRSKLQELPPRETIDRLLRDNLALAQGFQLHDKKIESLRKRLEMLNLEIHAIRREIE